MNLDPEQIALLVSIFEGELADCLLDITNGLLEMEKDVDPAARKELLGNIFRAAHSIKGNANSIGITDISDITHELEFVFSQLRDRNEKPSSELVDICFATIDAIKDRFERFKEGKLPPESVDDIVAAIKRCEDVILANETMDVVDSGAENVVPSESAANDNQAPEEQAEPEPDLELSSGDEVEEEPSPVIETEAALPTVDVPAAPVAAPVDRNAVGESVRVQSDKLNKVAARAEELQVTKLELEKQYDMLRSFRSNIELFRRFWFRALLASKRESTVRLPEAVTDLFVGGEDLFAEFDSVSENLHRSFRGSVSQLNLVANAVQDDIKMIRLVPVASIFQDLPRVVRDLSRDLGKKVAVNILPSDVDVDRSVLEELRAPLTHIIRNAIDHGIEYPKDRMQDGKPEQGTITVSASQQSGEFVVEIEDDGHGISADAIRESARRKKIANDVEVNNLSDEEVINLIFYPGFSSKEVVTSVSGRGVGLDVVAENIRRLKGSVTVDTQPGKRTSFKMQLPLTLATDRGLLIRCAGQVFVLPTTSVDRAMLCEDCDVITVEGTDSIIVDGVPVPVKFLHSVLSLPVTGEYDIQDMSAVVVTDGWTRVALVLDDVVGEQEIVIKPLPEPMISVENIVGGALIGGGMSLVLDPNDLVYNALNDTGQRVTEVARRAPAAVPHILVVDDSITTRTLEQNILESQGYRVTVAVNGKDGWSKVQSERFDLIVTDVEMPFMNGFELADKVKSHKDYKDTPVIIVTSLGSKADKMKGIEVGADAYIVKSQFETSAWLGVVKDML